MPFGFLGGRVRSEIKTRYNYYQAAQWRLCGVKMTDDQLWRGAITAASIPVWMWLIQKAKAHLSAERDQTGRSLAERLGYRLGRLWPIRHRTR